MTNSTKLPTDTYYRGYRLSWSAEDQQVFIYHDAELIDQSCYTREQAKAVIDDWHNAR